MLYVVAAAAKEGVEMKAIGCDNACHLQAYLDGRALPHPPLFIPTFHAECHPPGCQEKFSARKGWLQENGWTR